MGMVGCLPKPGLPNHARRGGPVAMGAVCPELAFVEGSRKQQPRRAWVLILFLPLRGDVPLAEA